MHPWRTEQEKTFLVHSVWSALPIGSEGHRCANILAYWCPPLHYYWRTDGFTSPIGRQNKRSKKKRGGPNSLVHFTYFQANRLLTELYKQETEMRWRKADGHIKNWTDIDRYSPKPYSNSSLLLDPPPFSVPTTFKGALWTCAWFC